jgi:hypothetical protein
MSKSDQVRPIFLPAGVAAPDQQIGYVGGMAGGIEALHLLTGELVWQSDLNARPVMVFENLLAALSPVQGRPNALQLIEIDRKEGEFVRASDSLVFPDWVLAAVAPNLSFSYEVGADGHDLIFEWEAHARYEGGAPPSARIQAQATQDAAGVARFNLRTGKVTEFPAHDEKSIELPKSLREENLFSYQRGTSSFWQTEPWAFDGKFAVLIGEVLEDRQTLKLQTWDAKFRESAAPVSLVTGQALVSYVTPEGLYLFVHSELQNQKRDWWLFSVITGKLLTVLNYEEVTRETCVVNDRVYYLVEDAASAPRQGQENLRSTLKAVDVASGKLLWERLLSVRPTSKQAALRQ